MRNKWKSRKFLMCLGEVCLGIGTTITGMYTDNETVVVIGAALVAIGTGIFTFCEALVDREAVEK